jgi:transposase InsO family protein
MEALRRDPSSLRSVVFPPEFRRGRVGRMGVGTSLKLRRSSLGLAHHGGDDLSAELVLATFGPARVRELPPPGLVHHSDRGVPYACGAFRARLTASMSRRANPYDNALAESFVATFKAECFAGQIPPTKAAARLLVFAYIETFYNPRRRHSSLGYLFPRDFKNICSPKQKPSTSTPESYPYSPSRVFEERSLPSEASGTGSTVRK